MAAVWRQFRFAGPKLQVISQRSIHRKMLWSQVDKNQCVGLWNKSHARALSSPKYSGKPFDAIGEISHDAALNYQQPNHHRRKEDRH